MTFQDWMLGELDGTRQGAGGPVFVNAVELDT